jgi:hypothetical protein
MMTLRILADNVAAIQAAATGMAIRGLTKPGQIPPNCNTEGETNTMYCALDTPVEPSCFVSRELFLPFLWDTDSVCISGLFSVLMDLCHLMARAVVDSALVSSVSIEPLDFSRHSDCQVLPQSDFSLFAGLKGYLIAALSAGSTAAVQASARDDRRSWRPVCAYVSSDDVLTGCWPRCCLRVELDARVRYLILPACAGCVSGPRGQESFVFSVTPLSVPSSVV